jgi:restriction endonuclease Mrr
MAVLDELSGYEFEDLMEDVFRNLGYENVRQAARSADEGRDILMEEVVDGTRRAVVVECKHTGSVGRPVVQKLHSAIATYDYDGPKRGMVVTTGRFSGPAEEYAQRLRNNDDPYPIELIDGTDLREIADEIGLDLYNGRIEILCSESLRPYERPGTIDAPVKTAFRDIDNIDSDEVPSPRASVTFKPIVTVTAEVNAVFETSVGIIHRINDRSRFVAYAGRGHPELANSTVRTLVTENRQATIDLEERREDLRDVFDDIEEGRFGQTQTEYKEWAVDRLRTRHTTTVTYTGDNNVTYNKTCEPKQSDISIQSIDPVYLPQIRQTVKIQSYSYPYEYYAAGPSRATIEDGIHRCVHCETAGDGGQYTYCANCGSISCTDHIETERLEVSPVCTGCAVTERFAFKTKYFYDGENLETFRAEYDAMPLHEKAMENKPLVVGTLVAILLAILMTAGSVGLI